MLKQFKKIAKMDIDAMQKINLRAWVIFSKRYINNRNDYKTCEKSC